MTLRRLLVLICLGAFAASVAACGRKGDPTLPPGQTDSYPRSYPAGSQPPDENIFDGGRPQR